jgi:hypothetical protein
MVDYTADTASRQQDDLDRLAARSLSARKAKAPAQRTRSVWPWFFVALLVALVLGMIASPWFERELRQQLPEALQADHSVAADPRMEDLAARVARLEARPAGALPVLPGAAGDMAPVTGRIAALEAQAAAFQTSDATVSARLEQLAADLQRTSGVAEAGDRQVRDLFMVSVARRMVESGRPLGPVLSALSARFSGQDAAAVDSLELWSSVPQTRASLSARLETMDETVVTSKQAEGPGFWDRLMSRISGLVTVREQSGEPVAADVLLGAREAMAGGDVALAASRLQRAPPSSVRDQWLSDARALLAAEAALDRLEMTLLDAASADAAALASAIVPPAVAAPAPATGEQANAPTAP